jgi:hypothetical protein
MTPRRRLTLEVRVTDNSGNRAANDVRITVVRHKDFPY